jgi:tetratricopeptide (TPR) repeat protein
LASGKEGHGLQALMLQLNIAAKCAIGWVGRTGMKADTLIKARDNEALIERARTMLRNGQLVEASQQCLQVLEHQPENADALYVLAVSMRLQKRFDDALSYNRDHIALDPSNGRAHQEMGHCLRDMGNSKAALAAYQEAVARNNALAGKCWNVCTMRVATAQLQISPVRRLSI